MGADRISKGDVSGACPFFSESTVERSAHQCLVGDAPLAISRSYAASYCLGRQHVECNLYVEVGASKRGEARRRQDATSASTEELVDAQVAVPDLTGTTARLDWRHTRWLPVILGLSLGPLIVLLLNLAVGVYVGDGASGDMPASITAHGGVRPTEATAPTTTPGSRAVVASPATHPPRGALGPARHNTPAGAPDLHKPLEQASTPTPTPTTRPRPVATKSPTRRPRATAKVAPAGPRKRVAKARATPTPRRSPSPTPAVQTFGEHNWRRLQHDPKAHIGARVRFVGTVVEAPIKHGRGAVLHVIDLSGQYEDLQVLVYTQNLPRKVKDGATVSVSGEVEEVVRLRSTTREVVLLPLIYADRVKVVPEGEASSIRPRLMGSSPQLWNV